MIFYTCAWNSNYFESFLHSLNSEKNQIKFSSSASKIVVHHSPREHRRTSFKNDFSKTIVYAQNRKIKIPRAFTILKSWIKILRILWIKTYGISFVKIILKRRSGTMDGHWTGWDGNRLLLWVLKQRWIIVKKKNKRFRDKLNNTI